MQHGISIIPKPDNKISHITPSASARRDRALESDIMYVLSLNSAVSQINNIGFWADGGVVHLRGSVQFREELLLLRKTLSLIRGVYAVWDLVECPGHNPLKILDIGCGKKKQVKEAIGVDRSQSGCAEIVADFEHGLPFADNSIDHIFAIHVLEHVNDLISLMNEIHRILKPEGVLHGMVPFWHHEISVADPTHVRFFVPQTFKVFCIGNESIRPYFPLSVSCSQDTVFVDLSPARDGIIANENEMMRFFL